MKAITIVAMVFSGIAALFWTALQLSHGDPSWLELQKAHRRGAEIDAKRQRWLDFVRRRESILINIERGRCGLIETVNAIEAVARECYPEYLETLMGFEQGDALDEKIANAVWRHLSWRVAHIGSPSTERAASRCRAEFRARFDKEPVDMSWL